MTTQQQAKYRLTCALMPHDVIGSNGTCPDHFVVVVSGENIPTSQYTLHRKQGEADYVFWERVMSAALEMTTVHRTCQLNLYRRNYQINIHCDYGNNTDTAYTDGFKNFERLMWSIAEDPEDDLQLYALTILDRLYNQTAQGTVH